MTDSPIHIYSLHELEAIPEPEWLIENILMRETIAAIAATKAAYKTFLALGMGLSVATGRAWMGRKVVQGNVLHLVGEGGRGIKLRAKAWQQHHGVWLPEPSPWSCTVQSVMLDQKADELIQAIVRHYPMGLELLVVDTLARNQSLDENSTAQMSKLVDEVEKIKTAIGCTVLFLHHFNRAGSFRGNSALDGAFDTIILMERNGDVVRVKCDKQKDAEEFAEFSLRRRLVPLDGGRSSMVLELDSTTDALTETVLYLVGRAAYGGGITKAEVRSRVLADNLMTAEVFESVWQTAVKQELLVPYDGLHRIGGTKWVRNLEKIDVAA